MSASTPETRGAARVQSRAESIAEKLRGQILAGEYEAGERLPSERELATGTGANRSSVREALQQLQQQGIIEIKRGDGARVVPLERSDLGLLQHMLAARDPDPLLLRQWMDVWRLVLSGAARLAVERASDAEKKRAVLLLAQLRKPSIGADPFLAASDELTQLISLASQNRVLQMVRNGLVARFDQRRDLRQKFRPRGRAFARKLKEIEVQVVAGDARSVSESVYELVGHYADAIIEDIAGSKKASLKRRN